MKILIGNEAIELDFSTKQKALETRAIFVMTWEEYGYDGFFKWDRFLEKHPFLKKAYDRAYGIGGSYKPIFIK